MYINGKMRPVVTVPKMGGGNVNENGEGIEIKYDRFDML
jgi:hypothetical protein